MDCRLGIGQCVGFLYTLVPPTQITDLLNFVLRSTYFQYNGSIHDSMTEEPWGAVSAVIANFLRSQRHGGNFLGIGHVFHLPVFYPPTENNNGKSYWVLSIGQLRVTLCPCLKRVKSFHMKMTLICIKLRRNPIGNRAISGFSGQKSVPEQF